MKIMTVENVVEMFKGCQFFIRWFKFPSWDIKDKSYRDMNTFEYGIAGYDYKKIKDEKVYEFRIDITHNICTIMYYYDKDKQTFPREF